EREAEPREREPWADDAAHQRLLRLSSARRRPGSNYGNTDWVPAYAGTTMSAHALCVSLLRRLEHLVFPAREQAFAAFLRAVFVEVDLDELHVAGLRCQRMDLRVPIGRDLELVDRNRDILAGGREHEIHPFARACRIGTALDDRRRDDLVAGALAWSHRLDRIALNRLRHRVVQEGDADRRFALAGGANA